MAKLLDQERSGGRFLRFWQHQGEKGRNAITVQTIEDVEPLIKRNRRLLNDAPKTPKRDEAFRKVASISFTEAEKIAKAKNIPFGEFWLNNTDRAQAAWNELLNDSNFRKFRTHPGRV